MRLKTPVQAILVVASLPVLSGCVSNPNHRDAERVAVRCPAGHTLTCEANRIGRIFQGTFRNNNDKCACMPDTGRTLDSPVIPTIRQ